MKKMKKISIFLFLIVGFTFTSCETTNLDLLNDPNNITLDNADLNRYLNQIQLDFPSFIETIGGSGARLTRVNYMFGKTYFNNFDSSTGANNTAWRLAYQRMFSDMKEAVRIAEEQENYKHIGVIKVLKAYTLMTLVDFYGDVPFSEANNLAEFPAPHVDDGAVVYEAALAMLDEAISNLNSDGSNLEHDFYYDNDFSKWVKLANTLKMNAYVNTRLVDGSAMNKFNAIVSAGNFINNSADDFEFRYGTSLTNPNTRHPGYNTDYSTTGAGSYRSNWLMDMMLDKNDPRRRYYFYRQKDCTPGNVDADGNSCPPNQQQIPCSGQTRPNHFPADMVFCSVAAGYWGRDHGNEEGIPPDSFKRTIIGVYPAAGKFDDDDYSFAGLDKGGQGAGITPIMLASWVDFMRAEMALANNQPGPASNFLQSAIQKSVAKAMSFISLDPDADSSFAPSGADVDAFVSSIANDFNAANNNGKWNILAEQQFVAHYGNGIDTYNMYRRTGFPTSLQFNIAASPGNFVRSFLYPSNEADVNSNITQKPNVDQQVFWDTNPPSPGFPFAN